MSAPGAGSSEVGRADVVALVLALVAGGGLVVAARSGGAPASPAAPSTNTAAPTVAPAVLKVLEDAESARHHLAASRVNISPGRHLRRSDTLSPGRSLRVADLDGRILKGTLHAHWTPAPGSTGTRLLVEGLGGPGTRDLVLEGPDDGVAALPVPGVSGTATLRAIALGPEGPGEEQRVSVPFRIPVMVIRATSASPATGSALVLLQRPFDGRQVEALFPVASTEPVGGLSSPAEGGSPVEFRTDYVLVEVRRRREAEPAPSQRVPVFQPDGRVARDGKGQVLTRVRRPADRVREIVEVLLRGPDDERRILPVLGDDDDREEDDSTDASPRRSDPGSHDTEAGSGNGEPGSRDDR